MSSSVTITSTIKLDALEYSEQQLIVMQEHGKLLRKAAKAQWRGWFYGKQNSPPTKYYGKPGESRDGWKMMVTGAESGHLLALVNNAKDPRKGKGRGKAYAGYIHRVGKSSKDPAWHEVLTIVQKSIPELETKLAEVALDALSRGQPPKNVLPNKPSEFVGFTLSTSN